LEGTIFLAQDFLFWLLSLSSTQTFYLIFFLIDVEEHRLNGEKVFFGSRTVIPNNNNAKLASEVSEITQYSLIHFQNAF